MAACAVCSPIIDIFPAPLLAAPLVSLTILSITNGAVVRSPLVALALSRQSNVTRMKNINKNWTQTSKHASHESGPVPLDSAIITTATVGLGLGNCEFSNNDTLYPVRL